MIKQHKDNSESKRQRWMQDLKEDISEEEWGLICSKAQHKLLTVD